MDALSKVRILEFGEVLTGPWAGQILALAGAEVIKVETGFRLCMLRRAQATAYGGRVAPYIPGQPIPEGYPTDSFVSNWTHLNKKGITLNLREPEAVELARMLISISDLVTENYRPGVMDSLGLGYAAAKEIKPNIIYGSVSTMGATAIGYEAKQIGYGPLFSALSGLGHITGYPDAPPTEGWGRQDLVNATIFGLSLLLALVYWQRTGLGQYIDFSAREGVAFCLGDSFMEYSLNGRDPYREGNRDDMMAPHNCYRCRDISMDRWVSIAVGSDEEWKAFCDVLGNPEWAREERFVTGLGRWHNQEELDKLIEAWTINYTDYEVMERLQQAGVAAMPSMGMDEIWTDPHLGARGVFEVVEHPKLGAQPMVVSPCRLSLTPLKIKRHGTMLGEDNQHVFSELLGLSQRKISDLIERRIIY